MSSDSSRLDYPFINCTNCGPRFTIIEGLPYDRNETTMRDFGMCGKCSSEYKNIIDRRFHAQPVACNNCGPEYTYYDGKIRIRGISRILEKVTSMVHSGKIVAVKGIGGYFLMCNAFDNEVVIRLRQKKQREAKPLAVMFRDIPVLKQYCIVDENEEKMLTSWRRPILILQEKKALAYSVSNGLRTIGAMLPYMPFHYLLFRNLTTTAVVLTSGNLSDEPIITDDLAAEENLMEVADAILSYNRAISNRADDSVIRSMGGEISIIRRSRGFVPQPVDLNIKVEGILALGAEQKNSFCIGKGTQAVMSQYIGDLKNAPTCDFYREAINRFMNLFRFRPACLACDLHPDYYSTVYASSLGNEYDIPVIPVQHHHAHIVSVMAEHDIDEEVIGIGFDGTGYGNDGNIWGGEFLVAGTEEFSRFAHFDYVKMPGGDKVVDEPWRMAFSYLFKYFGDSFDYHSVPVFRSVSDDKLDLVREMILNDINAPLTSSAGRLFDAVSALLDICPAPLFDSEAPMRLESALNNGIEECYPFTAGKTIDFSDTFKSILEEMRSTDRTVIAARFHNTVASAVVKMSEEMRNATSIEKVVLSGGVFQNRYLLEKTIQSLKNKTFRVYTNNQVPVNDGGIALGQLVVASIKSGTCV